MNIYGLPYQTYYTESGTNFTADGDGKILDVEGADLRDLVRQGLIVHDFFSAAVNTVGGALAGFSATLETTSPNDEANTSLLLASNGTQDQDVVIQPTGWGGFALGLATGDSVGGNKRGEGAVDLQIRLPGKNSATEVASGFISVIGGGAFNTSSNYGSVVGGGFGNTVSQGASTISGGYNNTADGDTAVIGGGGGNSASAQSATISGGVDNTASGIQSFIGGGTGNVASSDFAVVVGGSGNTADAPGSSVPGGWGARTRARVGSVAWAVGAINFAGDTQYSRMLLTAKTLADESIALTANHTEASDANQLVLPDASTFWVRGRIMARHDSTDSSAWTMDAIIKRGTDPIGTTLDDGSYQQVWGIEVNDGGADGTPGAVTITGTTGTGTPFEASGTIDENGVLIGSLMITDQGNYTVAPTLIGEDVTGGSLVGATVNIDVEWVLKPTLVLQDAGAMAWDVSIVADRNNGALSVIATGEVGKTITWMADIETLEIVL